MQDEATSGGIFYGGNPCSGKNFDSSLTSGGGQTFDEGLGRDSDGEYTSVVFGFKKDIA